MLRTGVALDVTLEQLRNYCGLIKTARCGFLWEKTTKRPIVSVYTNCEAAPAVAITEASRRQALMLFSVVGGRCTGKSSPVQGQAGPSWQDGADE
jgi:hypothetical protein